MRRDHSSQIVGLLLLTSLGFASPRQEESPSDQPLRAKGLTKVGTVYLLDAEKPVLASFKEARATFAAFAAMSNQQTTALQLATQATQLEEQRTLMQAQIDELNQRIGDNGGSGTTGTGSGPGGSLGGPGGGGGPGSGGMASRSYSPLTVERDQLKAALSEVTAQQKTIKNQSPLAKDVTSLDARVEKAQEEFKANLVKLRSQVDEVIKLYNDLSAEEAVKQPLAEAKKRNPKIRIGPSDTFNAGVKELVKAESRFLGKKVVTTSTSSSKRKTRSKK